MNNGAYYFCVGMGFGFGMAMLMAPKSGEATRALIRDTATDGAEYIKHSSVEFRDKALDLARKPAEAIAQQKDGLVAAAQAGKRAYAKAAHA